MFSNASINRDFRELQLNVCSPRSDVCSSIPSHDSQRRVLIAVVSLVFQGESLQGLFQTKRSAVGSRWFSC